MRFPVLSGVLCVDVSPESEFEKIFENTPLRGTGKLWYNMHRFPRESAHSSTG